MLTCFDETAAFEELDKSAFTFTHQLMDHPALALSNLGRAIPALPKEQVYYSSGKLEKTDDFDRAHLDKKNGLTIEATIERIRVSDSYIMVRSPEDDVSFKDLYKALISDVTELMHRRGVGDMPLDPMLYLFIASPNSVTPFHIDRYSTFLMQFRGRKTVTVFPMFDQRVVPAGEMEAFMSHDGRPTYRPESEALATPFDFSPGQAVHIPFMAGHHVKNGSDDVSVSMSIIFNTSQTRAMSKAMMLNHALRKRGLAPEPVGQSAWKDLGKSLVFRSMSRARRLIGR
ncbi:MAG: hypothetical protein QM817_28700 [Archangium sp.]